ncbi:hypothetical protein Pla123a_13280 [Posidoniimonas polymericola]|uniref:DUF3828 domain-containing protein n=1 Tax=Posidoniimonas polymericola TaxID=2528002 RepID=A0A5C5YUA9_9BACT|nr:hypothetical protein [Posidoniimonas polymericola]TWT78535.1 hypothetical protein Pla123a_13280 [Posidoniimonas polymericola]
MRSFFSAIAITLSVAACVTHADETNDLQPARDLQVFLKTARKADSFEQVLPLLPEETRDDYQRQESVWDKDAIRSAVKESSLFGDSADLFARTPYEKGLGRYRSMADKIRKYVSTEIDGDEATVHVETRVNGEWNPATVRMVREGAHWKFDDLKIDLEW